MRELPIPGMDQLPRPFYARIESMPIFSYFPRHHHDWSQFVHAISGVLWVDTSAGRFILPPGQALWLPEGVVHQVSAKNGAEFRSLYVDSAVPQRPTQTCILSVSPLVRELLVEACRYEHEYKQSSREERLFNVLFDQIQQLDNTPMFLPFPKNQHLLHLCEQLVKVPGDNRTMEEWADLLGLSSRTLARKFNNETGISFRSWRTQLRLLKSIELLNDGKSVTYVSLEMGYDSVSAFISAFKRQFGVTPGSGL